MLKISEELEQMSASGDFGVALDGVHERVAALEIERDALKADLEAAHKRIEAERAGCESVLAVLEAARKQDPAVLIEGKKIFWNPEFNGVHGGGFYASPVPAQQPAEVAPEYPMQPMFIDKGLPRFEKNPIVDWISDKIGLNEISIWWRVNNVDQKYIEQFYQLIGYSIRGYEELSAVSDENFERASNLASKLTGDQNQ